MRPTRITCILFITLFLSGAAFGQIGGRVTGAIRSATSGGSKADTSGTGFEHRDDAKDSISISYRFLDSLRRYQIDSSINDINTYYSVPLDYQYLGINGAAAVPLIYRPYLKAGFDPGFHAFDVYRFTLEDTRIYRTTRPFSSLGYQLASGQEQMITAQHTQNPRPNLNVGIDYRLISAPGLFVTQNTNHNNVRLFGNYVGKRKRYANTLVIISNTIKASQNGGIRNDSLLLDPDKKERFSIPVYLGNAAAFAPNPFSTKIVTGTINKETAFLLRQSYDLGKTDSVAVNDSTTEYLFYPRLRLQHTLTLNKYDYRFDDAAPDSASYKNRYGIEFRDTIPSINFRERWNIMSNDFSLLTYPDAKNQAQYLLAGATLQQIRGKLSGDTISLYNIYLHGEYRNRTRNKKWDLMLDGQFYLNGLDGGDYQAHASLSRYLNPKFGNIALQFSNVSRTPSFVFDNRSSYHFGAANDFNKENIINFGAVATNPYVTLGFNSTVITNYTYFKDFIHATQSSSIVQVLQVSASRKINLSRRLAWYIEAAVQQTDPNGPIKIPLVYTRSRIAYEGRFYKNLLLSTGLDIRYYTPYEAYDYSPVIQQFIPQDTTTIRNLPDVSAYLHFRIKGFAGFLRAENLNTASFKNGFGFINNNFAAPHYPMQGFTIRFGIRWWFVN